MERCFTMLKPGAVNRRIIGEVISRLEKKGMRLIAAKMMQITREIAEKHYAEHKGKDFYEGLLEYTVSGPVFAMVWTGDNCIKLIRKIVGSTDVTEAAPGTIRGDYSSHTQRNIIHASDSPESAEREIALFFTEGEIIDWKDTCAQWY